MFTLKNVKTEILQAVEVAKIRSNFIFAYCSTCHSAQGSSIDDTITMFDYNHFLIKNYPEWIWTAITRCRDLNKAASSRSSGPSLLLRKVGRVPCYGPAQLVHWQPVSALVARPRVPPAAPPAPDDHRHVDQVLRGRARRTPRRWCCWCC